MSRLCDGKARHSSWLIWFKFLMQVSPAVYMFPKTGTIIGGTERCTITLWASCSLWTSETTRRCPGNCGNYGNCWGCSPISLLKNLAVYLHDKSPVYTHFPSSSLHFFAIYQTEISKVLLRRLPQSSRKNPWDFPLKIFQPSIFLETTVWHTKWLWKAPNSQYSDLHLPSSPPTRPLKSSWSRKVSDWWDFPS